MKKYYEILERKKGYLFCKRVFDLIVSFVMSLFLLPIIIVVSIIIKIDSPGKVFFLQERITTGGKKFKIFKFRTMKENTEKFSSLTVKDDPRITRVGKYLRKLRIDEFPQIFNILLGDLSFVGTRLESLKYVKNYSPEMYATLLMPAGVTSMASIEYKDESKILENAENPDEIYLKEILPAKMKYNLEYIEDCNLWYDVFIIIKTVLAVIKK